ncbi:MAG: ribosome maturation factor RimM [Lachnospiraceae bacterium]|jgi:16S rRNA processing protein RimM|nr:ribosome maturation factor RimM [Lachnospiraceae bacterium]
MEKYLEVGQIVNTYGIKGFLKVVPFTDDISRFEDLKQIYIDINSNLEKFFIEEVKYSKSLVLLKLKGIEDITMAEKYKNAYLKIDRQNAVKLPKDTYFIVDLIGLDVFTEDNSYLGKVEEIFPTGSNDVYVVKNELGKQILIPALKDVIKKTDIENGKIIVNLIQGLEG